MDSEYLKYKSEELTVKYNPKICIHAAECVKGLPKVFNPKKKPWVEVGNASADEIIEVIKKCPTGALKYESVKKNKDEEFEYSPEVKVTKNGPLFIKGNISLINADGEEVLNEGRIAICRCGASENKPFCDNSHYKVKFNG